MRRTLGCWLLVVVVAFALAGCPGGTAPVADARWDVASWDESPWAP